LPRSRRGGPAERRLNIVNGDGETGAALVAHEGVDKVAFTGSTEVGRLLRRATAGTGKKLTLELGGKSPFIVFETPISTRRSRAWSTAIWFNQGEVCCAGARVLVAGGHRRAFQALLRARMEKLRVGDPLDKCMDMGAVVAPVQSRRITAQGAAGVAEGADMWQPSWAPRQ
jgi:aldehyde dehydrogenase (NAD+)